MSDAALETTTESVRSGPSRHLELALLLAVTVALFAIRLSAPANLLENNEGRTAAYVLDAVRNGHWFCQVDSYGSVTSKPPLYTWVAALATLPTGRISRFSLYLPGALATFLVAWTILAAGRERLGRRAALLAALAWLASYVGAKLVTMARFDAPFVLGVTLAAWAGFRAWERGRGWTWFWLAGAIATMSKGPFGLVLPAGGIAVAAAWEKRSGRPLPVKGPHALGIALFLLITGGWLALSVWELGTPVLHKMLWYELLQQNLHDSKDLPLIHFYFPTVSALVAFAPWSILGAMAIRRAWKHPAADPSARRFERFLIGWLAVGLVLLSLSAHQRTRLIYPVVPALALLAGRELARRLETVNFRALFTGVIGACLVFLGIVAAVDWMPIGRTADAIEKTSALRALADRIQSEVGREFPLTHVDEPFALQFYLNTMRQSVPHREAAELLRGDAAAYVVVKDLDQLRDQLGPGAPALRVLAQWPSSGPPYVSLVSNHPRLEWTDRMAAWYGPIRVEMERCRLERAGGMRFVLRGATAGGAVTLTNESDEPETVRVRWAGEGRRIEKVQRLAPHDRWRLTVPAAREGQ